MRILIAGTGFTGEKIIQALAAEGHQLWGVNRSGSCKGLESWITLYRADVISGEGLEQLKRLPPMDLLICAMSGSGQRDSAAYRELYVSGPGRLTEALRWSATPKVWMLGSTGVYGEGEGEWVNEETLVNPMHRQGEVQVEAEEALRALKVQHSVFRLSGLYGPGRCRLIRQALRKRPFLKPKVWSNQIHGDDVAGVLRFFVEQGNPPACINVSDREPALRQEIFSWVRRRCRYPEGLLDEDHPPRAKTDRGNKRVSSRLLQDAGYPFTFPTYREGLDPLCREWEAPSRAG